MEKIRNRNEYKNEDADIFTIGSYSKIIINAIDNGYKFMTIREFILRGSPKSGVFLLRHDFDKKPENVDIFINAEREFNVKSTTFIRVANNEYNPFSYFVYPKLKIAEDEGFEIGLHSNFVEFAKLNNLPIIDVLRSEWNALSSFYTIEGLACHRDINYVYNSLCWVEENKSILKEIGIKYQAYDEKIMNSLLYVNEGLNPHLCWRNLTPQDAIKTGRSICLLTHNHWWYNNHPFETF